MSYSHFSTTERVQLELLHAQGWSTRVIAQELGRHHSSIARELKRNQDVNMYKADKAQMSYEYFKTIYRWLYAGLLVQGSVQVLRASSL
ncbi:helix-turn-helix domain-containing protein [Paenibacillus apiarius]|uniref:helix-turn-helix domain-containing protein n=1 Tax=Paenibacillus apiarius TaxID=46240 RepID=UPI00197E8114|nr:helix-turn-helix domain-containing protein [Paenibacillus apiarius]MBN3523017.1 IS30 family transposase [Paenibacillus apiarius]